jgi:DNA-binding MltR family transcriptional regulator
MKSRPRIHKPTNQFIPDLTRVLETLAKESDRGCVLVAASIIEGVITDILQKFLHPQISNLEKGDNLFNLGRPCADAVTKLNLIQRLGIIDKQLYLTLKDLYELRNIFAHGDEPVSFEDEFIKNKVLCSLKRSENLLRYFVQATRTLPTCYPSITGDEEFLSKKLVSLGTRPAFAFFFSFLYYWLCKELNNINVIKN